MRVGPRHWALRYSEGFRVESRKGRHVGDVSELRFSGESEQPVALVVLRRGALGSRTLTIPADLVADVVAEEERIVLVSSWPARAGYVRRLLGWTGCLAPGFALLLLGDELAVAVAGLAGNGL